MSSAECGAIDVNASSGAMASTPNCSIDNGGVSAPAEWTFVCLFGVYFSNPEFDQIAERRAITDAIGPS
jgi:hypothetical protein